MIEEVKEGNRIAGNFSRLGWRNIVQGLKEKIGRDYTDPQLKKKYQSLRKRHRKLTLTVLIQEIGIDYNSCTGDVNASEDVWETLRRGHSLATEFWKQRI
ncbi:hypothetical protein SLEP1_g40675 [Rubroshorea leprosula]|uniref:Myb/SANT-like domain-containing protein n=1 Tax=Rubroshorea leprosula TaxID=152421 RepID=A0AAV5L455_9ROSI|nr:hypothetical protein SLEP1_g40675 [Rubroshorea leprosula]